jgi:hypothetical protein
LFELIDNTLKLRSFPAQSLGTRLIIPDFGMFEVAVDLLEALPLAIEVKDTPSEPDLYPVNP